MDFMLADVGLTYEDIKRLFEEQVMDGKAPYTFTDEKDSHAVVRIDDCIDVCYSFFNYKNEDEAYASESVGYLCSDNEYNVLSLKKGSDPDEYIVRLEIEGCNFPIDAEVICPAIIEDLNAEEKYLVNLAFFAKNITIYDDILDFSKKVTSFYKFAENEDDFSSYVKIEGAVKGYFKKTNSFSGRDYYVLMLEHGKTVFCVLAEESQVSSDIYAGAIVSVECACTAIFSRRKGTQHFLTFNVDVNKEDCATKIFDKIVSLDNLLYEFLVLSFEEADRVDNIDFIQTANCGAKYLLEVGKNVDGERSLFRYEECELHTVLAIFNDLCVKGQAPDLSGWEDVSYIMKAVLKEE